MTTLTKTLTFAAALMIAAGAASAQNLKADIPFAFETNGKAMPAGTYDVSKLHSASAVFRLQDGEGHAVMALGAVAHDPDKAWRQDRKPRLAFACADTRCTLIQVYTGNENPAYEVSRPKTTDIGTRIAVVTMRSDKGE